MYFLGWGCVLFTIVTYLKLFELISHELIGPELKLSELFLLKPSKKVETEENTT